MFLIAFIIQTLSFTVVMQHTQSKCTVHTQGAQLQGGTHIFAHGVCVHIVNPRFYLYARPQASGLWMRGIHVFSLRILLLSLLSHVH